MESLLRLEIRPGTIAAHGGQTVILIDHASGSHVRVRDIATGVEAEVAVLDLQSPASTLSIAESERRWGLVRNTTRVEWKTARRRERILRRCIVGEGNAAERVREACQLLDLSRRRVYYLLNQFRTSALTSSLVVGHRGTPPDSRRLSNAREILVMRAIEERFLRRPRSSVSDITEEIARRCRKAGFKAVSRKAIDRRIAALDPRRVIRSRHGARAARDAFGPVGGSYHVAEPLQVMQIDHTRIDVIAVTNTERKALGRPWLTLGIDVATRIVMGMFVTFDAPSITSVCLALTHACLPKDRWLESRGIDLPWDQWGLPAALHMDNAKEFHSEALRRGCDEYRIRKIFRPIARAHYGGHIERLIGTLMGRVHLLPGSTSSNVADRKGDDPSGTAAMTLAEIEAWLAVEIAGRYHRKTHRSLGVSPLSAWEAARQRGLAPTVPHDSRSFMVNFLPLEYRTLRKDGIHLFNIRYWSQILPLVGRSGDALIARYDPRNLSRIHVLGRDGQYHDVPYADLRHPPISIWEHRAASAWLRAQRRHVDEIGIFAALELQRAIESDAVRTTRLTRARAGAVPKTSVETGAPSINYNVPAQELEGEIWRPLV